MVQKELTSEREAELARARDVLSRTALPANDGYGIHIPQQMKTKGRATYLVGYEGAGMTRYASNAVHREWIAWRMGMAELWTMLRCGLKPRRVVVLTMGR